jgi:CheY-like chemotaxis protein
MAPPYTVLFVEDEPAMRELVLHILSAKGFNVLLAANGYEATGILAERAVDLMLTDIVMPGISGFDLAMQAKLMRPGLKILYTTGYSDQAKGGNVRYGKLLPKPLRPAELVWEINQALARSPP